MTLLDFLSLMGVMCMFGGGAKAPPPPPPTPPPPTPEDPAVQQAAADAARRRKMSRGYQSTILGSKMVATGMLGGSAPGAGQPGQGTTMGS